MRGSVVFLNQPFEETQNLLKIARDYVKWQAPLDMQETDRQKTAKITHEALRILMRLSQITVWLTLQKAILQDGLSPETNERILRGASCLARASETDPDLPPHLRDLLVTSRLLYERILRLDNIAHRHTLSANEIKREKKIRAI